MWPLTETFLNSLGLTRSIYVYNSPSTGETRFWTSLPEPWCRHYADRGYARIDPFFAYCCSQFEPIFTGCDYLVDYPFLTQAERSFIREASETGFQCGFSAPVRLIGNESFGGWNFGSNLERREFERLYPEIADCAQLIGFCIHERYAQLLEAEAMAKSCLSQRESECILWLARGLRMQEIADRLTLAPVTVEMHVRKARRKLGATTATHAVAKAILEGHIRP
ncbi:MAG: autoinducer binding domain-containing protein [Hyphomicrobiaceae bacterium]